jgi:hypothetical protein
MAPWPRRASSNTSPVRIVRRALRDVRPILAEGNRAMIGAVFAVLAGVAVNAVLPEDRYTEWQRQTFAVLSGFSVYYLVALFSYLIGTRRRMKAEWAASADSQHDSVGNFHPNISLNLRAYAEPTVYAVRCRVEGPERRPMLWSTLVIMRPLSNEYVNFPSEFPQPGSAIGGAHWANWEIQETAGGQWLRVARERFWWVRP